jgi:hypothetical protein
VCFQHTLFVLYWKHIIFYFESMSHFVSNKTIPIDLGGGEIVNIRESLSFDQILPFMKMQEEGTPQMALTIPLLVAAIASWNLLDDDGASVEVSEENIRKLKLETIMAVGEKVAKQYFPEKKESGLSKE